MTDDDRSALSHVDASTDEHAPADERTEEAADSQPADDGVVLSEPSEDAPPDPTLSAPPIDAIPDVDAALSALSALNQLAEPEPKPFTPYEVVLSDELPQPPLMTLERGTAASVVPALLLIAAGFFFTFYLASGNPMPALHQLVGGGLVWFGISSIAWWLSTSRWARGSLFVGAACLASGAALVLI
jgi:hypothetical protein